MPGLGGRGTFHLRALGGRLKVQHSILPSVKPVLERLLIENSTGISRIIPGSIKPVADAKGTVKARVTIPIFAGFKALALADGARQELFITTSLTQAELEDALNKATKAK